MGTTAEYTKVTITGSGGSGRTTVTCCALPVPPQEPKRSHKKRKMVESEHAELARLRASQHASRRSEGAADGEFQQRLQVERKLRIDDRRNNRHHLAEVLREAQRAANLASWARSKMEKEITVLKGQLASQVAIANALRDKIKTMTPAEEMIAVRDQLDLAGQLKRTLSDALELRRIEVEQLEEAADARDAELAEATAGPGTGRFAETNAPAYLKEMKVQTGVATKSMSVPARQSDSADAKRASTRHMAAVLKGRGEGDDINLVADALHRAGYLEPLMQADRVVEITKRMAQGVAAKQQAHWTALHAVHIWDRLELSREQMESLRHLLSFIYNPATNEYEPIKVWENKEDKTDFVLSARLAGRTLREAKYCEIAKTMNIEVGENGRCERDFGECTALLYSKYAKALRQQYSLDRPAQPVLFLDGTGGPLGTGICHGEVGCADFVAVGDSDAKQSRATLQPVFLYAGNDHAQPLRDNLELSIKTYNALVNSGTFDRVMLSEDGEPITESLPARPITAADMQGAKTTYGMRECPHSVWCKCQSGEGGPQFRFPDHDMETYEEMIQYIETEVGCELKTFDEMCGWAHYSPGVARGGKFTRFTCSCCGYNPTEKQWRADLEKWHGMSDEDRAAARAAHMDVDDPLNSNFKHYHQELYMAPLPQHGMNRCGVDDLHLCYLNMFKHYFRFTIHGGPLARAAARSRRLPHTDRRVPPRGR